MRPGLRRFLGLPAPSAQATALALAGPPGQLATATTFPSPLSSASIRALDPAAAVAFGLVPDSDTVTRREAMRVPAVRRGRAIIAGTIGSLDWQARRGDVVVDRVLVEQPDPNTTPQWIYSWTVDDLLFNGVAWWRVTETDAFGYPNHIERITRDRVFIEYTERWGARAYVDGVYTPDNRLIRFDGPDEGILEYGPTCLRTAIMLEQAVRKFARLDVPLGYLTPAEGATEISTEPGSANDGTGRSEVDALLDEWEAARADRTTAFLNRAVNYQTVMFDAQKVQLSEARQHQAAEVARLMNLPPRYVNAPQASGMTYATTEGDRRDLLDTTLNQYVTAIEQRLSMGDVTPRGQRVVIDTNSWLRGDTKTILESGQIAVGIGAMDADEVRTEWLGLPARTMGEEIQ